VEIEEYGNAKCWWFNLFLELPHGIPSHDTFGRVFARINPKQFRASFMSCVKAMAELINDHVAVDGKMLRRSHDHTNSKKALHMVSAWSSENRMVLGQEKVRDKSNEIIAIPELLELLDIAKSVITIDAMGCQTKIAQKIVDSDANYVLALKKNQEKLFEIVDVLFSDPDEIEATNCDYYKDVTKGHGRIETRECWATNDEEYLAYIEEEIGHWPRLQSLIMVKSERRINGESSTETRYFISSLPPDAEALLGYIRSHWGIENKLHWVLDMAFREDESRVRQGHATENLAIMRHLCLNLLKKEATAQCGIKAKRLKAGWNMNYLFKVLSA
ncbi:MAG: ISAs1 family transposase, partial [Chloroflexota bacterium]|nr:ISAs1 family transposase [Chloroflexota bacterium]